MKINKYPDGSSYVENTVINRDYKTFFLNSYEDLWYLNQYVDAFNHHAKFAPNILIPNLIDAQADRRFNHNESSGLKLVCKFLNGMNAKFKIFHPHNPEVVEALMDNVEIIDNSEFIQNVCGKLYYDGDIVDNKWNDSLILMSSDAGGFKPLMKLCDNINWKGETYSASKSRKYIDGKSELTQLIDKEDFQGKDILIVDDICVYGGTFKGLSKLLKERNCGKLYLAVSHMTTRNLGYNPVTNYFDKIFTTNSKYDSYIVQRQAIVDVYDEEDMLPQPENLEIIKLF